MGTGKRRISLAGRGLAARVVGNRVPAPELARVVAPELERVPGAELALDPVVELERVPGAAELERDLVAAELELVPVVAVPGLARVVAAPVRGRPRVQRAVALRTKSVTAAHHRGQAHLAAEDLAAVVETTREPAATEAAVAWAVADIAVVVAEDGAAVE
jgi:hypothetical protein